MTMSRTPCISAFGQCLFTDGCSAGVCRRAIAVPAAGRAMQPSMGFRWLERAEPVPGAGGFMQTVKVLQQGWAPINGGQVEWVDVPTVQA
jgi:hypothetical protein